MTVHCSYDPTFSLMAKRKLWNQQNTEIDSTKTQQDDEEDEDDEDDEDDKDDDDKETEDEDDDDEETEPEPTEWPQTTMWPEQLEVLPMCEGTWDKPILHRINIYFLKRLYKNNFNFSYLISPAKLSKHILSEIISI